MSAHRRREQDRKRARRARRRAERERSYTAAVEAMRVAREERLARLGPLVEMYGEGSQLLRMIDVALREQLASFDVVVPRDSAP